MQPFIDRWLIQNNQNGRFVIFFFCYSILLIESALRNEFVIRTFFCANPSISFGPARKKAGKVMPRLCLTFVFRSPFHHEIQKKLREKKAASAGRIQPATKFHSLYRSSPQLTPTFNLSVRYYTNIGLELQHVLRNSVSAYHHLKEKHEAIICSGKIQTKQKRK